VTPSPSHRSTVEISAVAGALLTLREARRQADEAYERVRAAELHLAEIIGVQRRDKDMGFDAEYEAKELLVERGLQEYGTP